MKAVKTAPILLFSAVLEEGEDFEAAGPPHPTASFTCEGERPERASSFFAEQSQDRRATEQGAPGATERHPLPSRPPRTGKWWRSGKRGRGDLESDPPSVPVPGEEEEAGGIGITWTPLPSSPPPPASISPSLPFVVARAVAATPAAAAATTAGAEHKGARGGKATPAGFRKLEEGGKKTTPKPNNRRERIRKRRRRPGMRSAGWQQGRWVRAPPGGAH